MYINFKLLFTHGKTVEDLMALQSVKQRDDIVNTYFDDRVNNLIEDGFIENNKSGSLKLTNKGSKFLTDIESTDNIDGAEETLKSLIELYESYGKETGIYQDSLSRLKWFIGNTGFRPDTIIEITESYLIENKEYTLRLDNLIWKPQSTAFSIHKSIKNSKLFDLITRKYKINQHYFFKENKDKEVEWLFSVGRLTKPPTNMDSSLYMTGSRKSDIEFLENIKRSLLVKLKS